MKNSSGYNLISPQLYGWADQGDDLGLSAIFFLANKFGVMPSPEQNQPAAPIQLQVVFQGGGAKLVCLMAVADVLQTFQKNGRIEVTRVAGSSAGAIAAVMLATGHEKKSLQVYKSELLRIGKERLRRMQTSSVMGLFRLAKGDAYFSDPDLKPFFKELISKDGPQFLQDLSIGDTRVYCTDLYSLTSQRIAATESIDTALALSCNFPFAFVGYRAGNTKVDGGLALNLPVDELQSDTSKGPVIAIGFKNDFGSKEKRNPLSYVQQLFSAAIQSAVYRSEALLGIEHVHRINTKIGTFDFDLALTDGLGSEYERISLLFASWLEEWLSRNGAGTVDPAVGASIRLRRPVLSSPWPMAVINEFSDRIKAESSTKSLSVFNLETAMLNAEGQFEGKYLCRALKTFEIVRATNSIQFSFQVGQEGSLDRANFGCSGYDSRGVSLQFSTHIQDLTKPGDDLRTFRVYFLFDEPLLPDSPHQPYTVQYQYEGADPYPNLGARPEAASLGLRQGAADMAVIGIAFPRSKLHAKSKVSDIHAAGPDLLKAANYELDDDVFVPSQEMQLFEFVDLMNLIHDVEKYWLVGRRVQNTARETAFGFVIE